MSPPHQPPTPNFQESLYQSTQVLNHNIIFGIPMIMTNNRRSTYNCHTFLESSGQVQQTIYRVNIRGNFDFVPKFWVNQQFFIVWKKLDLEECPSLFLKFGFKIQDLSILVFSMVMPYLQDSYPKDTQVYYTRKGEELFLSCDLSS